MSSRRSPARRAPHARLAALMTLVALAALAPALGGCKHGYTGDRSSSIASQLLGAPAPSPGVGRLLGRARSLYPLAVGNRWDYDIHTTTTVVTDQGAEPPVTDDSPLAAEIVATAHIGERDYFLQSESDPRIVGATVAFPMRGDASGLFELDRFPAPAGIAIDFAGGGRGTSLAEELRAVVDRSSATAAHRAAFERAANALAVKLAAVGALGFGARATGGPDPDEIAVLRYPVFVGAHWIVRDSPQFARTVVGRDRLEVPAGRFSAWRIRGTSDRFGPDDRVAFWYAAEGLIRIRVHAVGEAVDDQGNLVGKVLFDSDQVLTALHLVDSGPPRALASTGGDE